MIRGAPTRYDYVDFKSIMTRTSETPRISVVTGDKGLVIERLHALSAIPARYEHV
jgi:hypothetical protein